MDAKLWKINFVNILNPLFLTVNTFTSGGGCHKMVYPYIITNHSNLKKCKLQRRPAATLNTIPERSNKLITWLVFPQFDGPQMTQRIVFGSMLPCLRFSFLADIICELSSKFVTRIVTGYRTNRMLFLSLSLSANREIDFDTSKLRRVYL